MTFHVPVRHQEMTPQMFNFSRAVTKMWIHLDCDLDHEVRNVDGRRGIDYGDERNVVVTRLGVTSLDRYNKLLSEGFYHKFDSKQAFEDKGFYDEAIDLIDSEDDDKENLKPPAKVEEEKVVLDPVSPVVIDLVDSEDDDNDRKPSAKRRKVAYV